jgi:hypothetical protein
MQPRTTHRRPVRIHALRAGFLPLVFLLATAGSAFAADAPPTPDKGLALYSPVGGYALMALGTAAVISVSLLPSKRGHQD